MVNAAIILVQSKCIHDKIIHNQTMIYINDTHIHHQRLLQGLGFGPIRIHYEYNTTTVSSTDPVGKNLMKIMNIINEFWVRTI